MITNFEQLLSSWSHDLPSYLQYNNLSPLQSQQQQQQNNISPPSSLPGHIASLHIYYQTLFLMLHYPYIASHNTNNNNYYYYSNQSTKRSKLYLKSLNVCTSAANAITHIAVESLNNVYTCITFPTMFYCLIKASKIHLNNISSEKYGLALSAYHNITKTLNICHFYEQNHIMTELATQTIKILENALLMLKISQSQQHFNSNGGSSAGKNNSGNNYNYNNYNGNVDNDNRMMIRSPISSSSSPQQHAIVTVPSSPSTYESQMFETFPIQPIQPQALMTTSEATGIAHTSEISPSHGPQFWGMGINNSNGMGLSGVGGIGINVVGGGTSRNGSRRMYDDNSPSSSSSIPTNAFTTTSPTTHYVHMTSPVAKQTKLVFNDINKIEEGKYCQLIQKNFTSIDVIVAPDALFQMTVGKSHPINMTGIRKNLVEKMGGKSGTNNIYFYFVILKDLYDNYFYTTHWKLTQVPGDKFTVWVSLCGLYHVLQT
nr:10000_t:CDS:2 [Entrophospora candida]